MCELAKRNIVSSVSMCFACVWSKDDYKMFGFRLSLVLPKLKVKVEYKQFESNRKPSGVRERDSNHLGWLANSASDAHY